MATLNCYVATFNCGRALVDVGIFAANFFNGVKSNLPPDLVVLCLEEIAPIAYSFLGGSFLAPYFTRMTTAIHVAAARRFEREDEYVRVLVRNVGMTAIMVFARRSLQSQISSIETAGVGVGWWEAGNKGAVAVRLGLEAKDNDDEEVAITFVAAHLVPGEIDYDIRNENWKSICRGLVFRKDHADDELGERNQAHDKHETEPLLTAHSDSTHTSEETTIFSPPSHLFFAGDLNYRSSDSPPKLDDFTNWPQPVDTISDIHHYSHLLENDQLNRERKKGNTLHHLSESAVTFPPTYKYSTTAQKRATSASLKQAVNEDQAWLWAKHRVPSWCDRILYLEAAPPTVHGYEALPVQPTSDHRPVVLSFSLPLQPVPQAVSNIKSPFPIRKDWKEARAAARRYELMIGLAAYLTLTWEGELLLGGTVIGIIGGYLALRALVGT